MSEYWVSHKRYQCKYCNIYIADDKPSRQQHENGLRHKGNVERFVRGLYKEEEKRAREKEEEKGIMASVGKAAEAAYALDVASGRAGPSSSGGSTRPTSAPKAKIAKPLDPYANYSTPASLGYGDTDAEERQERMCMGVPGEWSVVVKEERVEEEKRQGGKRSGPEGEEEEEEERVFKLQKKTTSVGLGEIYDPDMNRLSPKEEKNEPSLFRKRRRGRQA